MTALAQIQGAFTEYLRDPAHTALPQGLDKRRMSVYSELVFNNLSGLLKGFFPVAKAILSESQWDSLVRGYLISHQSQTPYFPKIAKEFVQYLSHRPLSQQLPSFLTELMHYEWMELDLFTRDAEPPDAPIDQSELGSRPLLLSLLAEPLRYQYPVHRIRKDFQPTAPNTTAVHLLVLRDKTESVRFFELEPLSFTLMDDMRRQPGLIAMDWFEAMATQLKVEDRRQFTTQGIAMLRLFNEHLVFTPSTPKEDVKNDRSTE